VALLMLKIEAPDAKPEICKVPADGLTLGRHPGNTIVVADDTTVSGRHLRIDLTDQGMTVQDLKSSNGTRVNGKNIGHLPYRLKPGDVIQVGKTKITVVEKDEKGSGIGSVISGVGKKIQEVTGRIFGGKSAPKQVEPGFAVCPKCGAKIHVGIKVRGSRIGCPRCKEIFLL
jgi:hypothetical protein